MLWVEHTFVALIIARWLWRVGSWFAAVHAENMRCAELMLEARLNAEIINRSAAQRRENKVGCVRGELQDALQPEWQWNPVEGNVNQLNGKVKENWGSLADDERFTGRGTPTYDAMCGRDQRVPTADAEAWANLLT